MTVTVNELTTANSTKLYEMVSNDIISSLPQVTLAVIEHNLDIVMNEFFREGAPWIQELGPYEIKADEEIYSLNPLDNLRQVINVTQVYIDGSWIFPTADSGGARQIVRKEGTPRQFFCPDPAIMRWVPIPTADHDDLYVVAVMKASAPKTWVPGFIVDQYLDTILDGVYSRLYRQPSKPYSDQRMAEYHTRRFRNRCRLAKDKASRGYTKSTNRFRFPYFGRSERRVKRTVR